MVKNVLNLIKSEDVKNPLTDEEIALKLNLLRKDIVNIRQKNNIQDSRERRKGVLIEDIRNILLDKEDISDRELTRILNKMNYDISRFIVSKLRSEIVINKQIKIENSGNIEKDTEEYSAFNQIIGNKESLKTQINQAKAAILYPPNGLHTLIYGPSGVGKSQLAEAMHNFAIESGKLTQNAPFIIFNCADYAHNPQLIVSQLFGYGKGSFTGAENSKEGLVEKADGGILFLDEVHRLPSEGQEMLFNLLDKSKFTRLGETKIREVVKIIIIVATTENLESSLLTAFRRRIPMVIELPELKARPLLERYLIISHLFLKEAIRINKSIVINVDALEALLVYDCSGNIGQLRSDIQVACAKSFLNRMISKSKGLIIDFDTLPKHVYKDFINIDRMDVKLEKFISTNMVISNLGENKTIFTEEEIEQSIPVDNIYQFIEDNFHALENEGYSEEETYNMIGKDVDVELKKFIKKVEMDMPTTKDKLEEVVGSKITDAVRNAINVGKLNIKSLQDNLFYPFSIHMSATYERIKSNKTIINPKIDIIKINYPLEFTTAKLMGKQIEKDLKIILPDNEIGFIAMYLKTFSGKGNNTVGRIGVIVLTHGKVGKEMAYVANKLLNVNIAVGIEMSLDESPMSALEKTTEVVKKINQGKGCVILADMGSLLTFGDIIKEKTGIPVKTISRVDTVMVLETVRKVLITETTLNDIKNMNNKEEIYRVDKNDDINKKNLQKVIITICITGNGAAKIIKKFIENQFASILKNYKIISIGITDTDIDEEIKRLKSNYNIIAFVGTINPNYKDIPFISAQEIMTEIGEEKINNIIESDKKVGNILKNFLNTDLIVYNFDAMIKNDIIDKLIEMLKVNKCVDDQYVLSVYKRESMGCTLLKCGIAIPHGYPEHVSKPAIAIAKLMKPIRWEGNLETDLIFMIAINENSKDCLIDLFKAITNKDTINKLKEAKSKEEIKEIIYNSSISAK